jgi:DUF1365 family protein
MATTVERIAIPDTVRTPAGPTKGSVASAIYECRVMHQRFFPIAHRFSYGVWYLLADLDELPGLDSTIPGFGYERTAPVSFYARDHGPRDGSDLRVWVEARLGEAGIALDGGAVRLLCFPRVLGYTFNPITVWFCHGPAGELRAILYEVSNTFGEWHHYLVPVTSWDDRAVIRSGFDKELFVSPFTDMASTYDFRTRIPDGRIAMSVRQRAPGGQVLVATLTGRRRALTGRALARVLARYPLVTAKVTLGIHLEALRLRRKGAPYRRRGIPPANDLTIVGESPEGCAEA